MIASVAVLVVLLAGAPFALLRPAADQRSEEADNRGATPGTSDTVAPVEPTTTAEAPTTTSSAVTVTTATPVAGPDDLAAATPSGGWYGEGVPSSCQGLGEYCTQLQKKLLAIVCDDRSCTFFTPQTLEPKALEHVDGVGWTGAEDADFSCNGASVGGSVNLLAVAAAAEWDDLTQTFRATALIVSYAVTVPPSGCTGGSARLDVVMQMTTEEEARAKLGV